ncbi:MAG TPA: hypothetical protein VGB97_00690 [Candidatus Paceibacterota bacterium]|jgi:cyanophycin synthetase
MELSDTGCAACGRGTEANHLGLWITSTGDVFTLWLPMGRVPFHGALSRLGDAVTGFFGRIFFTLGRALGLVTLTTDVETSCSDRSRLLWLEAKRRNIPMEQLLFRGQATDSFRVTIGGKTRFFKSLPLPSLGDPLRMDDKVLFKQAMRTHGLPVPESVGVTNARAAKKALKAFGTVCVKPRSGSNGRHTYPYVQTEQDVEYALKSVKEICAFASVEEHLEGNLCRATCVGDTMVGFLESYYPTVTGNGSSTVQELVAAANERRDPTLGAIVIDDSYRGYIRRRGFELDSVVPEGTRLQLTYRGGISSGGGNREHGRAIHPSFIEPIERAARMTGLPIVGFDLIVPDAQAPADSQKWGFVEANSLPWIDLHAKPHQGEPIDLSVHVWDLWLKEFPGYGTR